MQMRTRALERRRMPDELDRMLTVASSRAWLLVLALAMAVTGLVVWGFAGNLPRQLAASGVLIAGPTSSVQATGGGRVETVGVRVGEIVRAGEVIVRLEGRPLRTLTSPFTGRVESVDVAPGQVVRRGTPLLTLDDARPKATQLRAVVFVSPEKGAAVTPGMDVNLDVSSAPSGAFGVVRGRVSAVSPAPASLTALTALLGNPDLARRVSRDGPPLVVRVRPLPDAGTPSGLRWSTGKGAPFALRPGVSVDAQIVQSSQSPVDLLFGT